MAVLEKSKLVGKVAAVLTSPDREAGLEKARVDRLEMTFDGIAGDCHAGRIYASDSRLLKQYKRGIPIANTRQVSIVSSEQLDELAGLLGVERIEPEWLGANLVTSGIPDFTYLPPATRLMFSSGATLIADGMNAPCRQIADVIETHHPGIGRHVVSRATGLRGIVAWVEKEGGISAGDDIVLHIPPQRLYSHS